jgi:hypothetical protein
MLLLLQLLLLPLPQLLLSLVVVVVPMRLTTTVVVAMLVQWLPHCYRTLTVNADDGWNADLPLRRWRSHVLRHAREQHATQHLAVFVPPLLHLRHAAIRRSRACHCGALRAN